MSDVGCRMLDFRFRISDVGWLGCRCWVGTLWLGESVVRRGRPDLKGGCRISDFGFRLAGMPVLGGDTLAARIVLRRGRPGLTGGTRRTFRRGCSGRR